MNELFQAFEVYTLKSQAHKTFRNGQTKMKAPIKDETASLKKRRPPSMFVYLGILPFLCVCALTSSFCLRGYETGYI